MQKALKSLATIKSKKQLDKQHLKALNGGIFLPPPGGDNFNVGNLI